jgi:flagellar biosynthetic protein FlhB
LAEQEDISNDDRTEEATQERRDEFRERGQLAQSKEITGVATLLTCAALLVYLGPMMTQVVYKSFVASFQEIAEFRVNEGNILGYLGRWWIQTLIVIVPIFVAVAVISVAATFLQTRFSWSWKKLEPDFQRMNPMQGIIRMVGTEAAFELIKSMAKMTIVGFIAFLILKSEWPHVPGLLLFPVNKTWAWWKDITMLMIWNVSGFLLFLAAADYFYNWFSLERRMKMTKQEVKDEYKRRETDPQVKMRMRRIQRDMMNKKTLEKTRQATALITNPTHYAVAIKYELGMAAPLVVAKGIDFLALSMREVAKELDIPIIENKPLARTLYKVVEPGQEIPESLYKAVAEVIRYVFKLKKISVPKATPNRNSSKSDQRNL